MHSLVLAPQPFMTQRGTPLATKMLLEALSDRGYKLDVVIFAEGEDVEIPNCTFTRVPALPGLGGIKPGFSIKKLICDMIMVPMVAWKLARNRYDLVIAVEEMAYVARLMRPIFRVPYIFDVDSSIPEQVADKSDPPKWVIGALERLERGASRKALAAITCCKSLKETVRGYAPGLPILVLEDVTMLEDPDKAVIPDDLPTDAPAVMYVGNLEVYQGVGLLLDAFRHIDRAATPARLVVIGGSEDHIAAYRKRAEELGISSAVSFLGPRPVDQLENYLAGAAITVSPRTRGRNTPMKIYSYLDSGRPLVATRLETHTQVLDDEISMLVEPTPEDMARGLSTLLANDRLRQDMAARARKRVAEEFSRSAYLRKVNTFFDEVVEPRLAK